MGLTVLHRAVDNVHFEVVEFLVVKCDVDVNAKKRVSPIITKILYLTSCLNKVTTNLFLWFSVSQNGQTPLHEAVAKRSTRLLRLLVEAGADIDCRDHNGSNILSIAAEYGYPELVIFFHEIFSVNIFDDYKNVSNSFLSCNI